jgi:Holliday junction resolvase RusA-like endonuclease
MIEIQFRVDGIPKAQPRPKARNHGGFVRVYDPGTAEDWKNAIAAKAIQYRPKAPTTNPVKVSIHFWMPRPNSHYNKKGEVKPIAPFNHIKKPDIDNCIKAVMDSLNGLGFWVDDSQVFSVEADKNYASYPGAVIVLSIFE